MVFLPLIALPQRSYRKVYENEGERFALDEKVQVRTALPESTPEGKKSASFEKTINNSGAKREDEDDGERFALNAVEVQFCSDDDSKALLIETASQSNETINCGKENFDGAANKNAEGFACSSKFKDETATQEDEKSKKGRMWNDKDFTGSKSVVPQSSCHEDELDDHDFSAKDLLCFAWQIAKGMVSHHQPVD